MLDGSTENSATTGLPEPPDGPLVDPPAGAGGGGGGIGVFLLQADAIRTITTVSVRAALFDAVCSRSMEHVIGHNYLTPQTGDLLSPCAVNCFTCVPSASIV